MFIELHKNTKTAALKVLVTGRKQLACKSLVYAVTYTKQNHSSDPARASCMHARKHTHTHTHTHTHIQFLSKFLDFRTDEEILYDRPTLPSWGLFSRVRSCTTVLGKMLPLGPPPELDLSLKGKAAPGENTLLL